MATPNNSISFQCKWIRDVLSNWAKAEGGVAVIAHDLNSMWELAFNTSKVPRCIICFTGETIRGDADTAAYTSRVDRDYVVLITRGKGATANRGDTLTEQIGDQRPFYDLLEEARDLIRVIQFDPSVTEAYDTMPLDYKGIRPALPEDYPLDAYMIEFSIGTQLGIPHFDQVLTAPSAPFNLTAPSVSSTVTLAWDVDSFDSDSTNIFRSSDNINYTNIDTVNGSDVVTYEDTTPISGSSYYKVNRTNTGGTSNYSNILTISI
jgi:hypothetical protein